MCPLSESEYVNSKRTAFEVVAELLREMNQTVTCYHPEVGRTSDTVEGLIQGTACFPGGSGLWRGNANGGPLPDHFPDAPVMFVGHNFDSVRGYAASHAKRGEVKGEFWIRLLQIIKVAGLGPVDCFFSNVLMGLKPGNAEGDMPSVPCYREQCARFLECQVRIVRPRAVVALGVQSRRYVSRLTRKFVVLRHPSDWCFRPLATRDPLLLQEGEILREFLVALRAGP